MAALKRFGWLTTKLVAFTGLAIVSGASLRGLPNVSSVQDRVRKELLEERWQSYTAAQKKQECFQAFMRALNGYYSIAGIGTIRDASVGCAERCRRLAVREVYESGGADYLYSRCSFVEPDERASGAFEAFLQQERARLGVTNPHFLFDEICEAQAYSRYQTGRRTVDEEKKRRQGKVELEQLVVDRIAATPSYQAELQGSLGRSPAQVNDLALRRLKPQSTGALLMKQTLDNVPESEQQRLCWADL
ncbi:hypothetical protein Slin14017_G052540 [Septoria linicola]|nr:hypothetical protein Slin14017_G052540 [Septoria linicola]